MSSAFSTIRNYGPYVQPYDLDLLQKGLEYKQQKYDVNSAAIQSQIDQLSNLKLAKGADQEYLNARLNTLVQQVNKFGAVDLSSTGVTKNIQNHVKQALDQNVMTAYIGTENLANLRKEIEDVRKNKPKSYSSQNEAYALRGAVEWLNDGQVGSSYSGGTYIPYTDVAGKQQKALKELYKDSESVTTKPETVFNPATGRMEPTGRMITVKLKGLADEEIASMFESGLSSQDRQQMEIDAWATYGQNPAAAVDMYNRYTDNRRGELTKRLEAAQQSGNSEHIKLYTNALESLNTQVEDMRDNPNQIGMFLQKENMMGGLKTAFRKRQVGFEYKNDAAYWNHRSDARATVQQQHNFRKDQANLNLRQAELQLKRDDFNRKQVKDAFDIEQKLIENDLLSGVGSSFLKTGGEGEIENFDPVAANAAGFVETEKNLNSLVQNMLNTDLKTNDLDIAREVDDLVQTTGMDRSYAKAVVVNNKVNPLSEKGKAYKLAFKDYNNQLERQKQIQDEVKTQFNEAFDTKMPIVFEKGNQNIRRKYEEVLGFELNTFEELNDSQQKELKKVMLADVINTKVRSGDEKNLQPFVDNLSDLMGEKIKVNKRAFTTTRGVAGGGVELVETQVLDIEASDRVKSLVNRGSNIRSQSSLNPFAFDNSITTDDDFKPLLDGTVMEETQKNILLRDQIDNTGKRVVPVKPVLIKNNVKPSRGQLAVSNALQQALNDPDTDIIQEGSRIPFRGSSAKFLKELSLKPTTPFNLVAESGADGKVEIQTPSGISVLVRREILDPNLAEAGIQLDYSSVGKKQVFLADKATSSEPIRYIEEAAFNKNERFLSQELGSISAGGSGFSAMATLTPKTTLKTLSKTHNLTPQQREDIKSITASAQDLTVDLSIDRGNIVTDIKNASGVSVYSTVDPVTSFPSVEEAEKRYEEMVGIQVVAPQYFMYTMLNEALTEEAIDGEDAVYKISEIKQQIQDGTR